MNKLLQITINTKRIYGLDILRAIAILFVLIFHSNMMLPHRIKSIINPMIPDGVTIFFVLSGYLIGGILIKMFEKESPNRHLLMTFWLRRWFRTLPNYFLILIVLVLYEYLTKEGFSFRQVDRYFIFSQNLWTPHPSFFPEAWSLSVEEWFYLITPIVILILIKLLKFRPKTAILATAIGVILVVIMIRFNRYNQLQISSIYQWELHFRKVVITRLDSLMIGVMAGYLAYYYKRVWLAKKEILFFLGVLLFIVGKIMVIYGSGVFVSIYQCVFSFNLDSLATFFLIPYLSTLQNGKGFIYKGLTYTSLISYSLYLVHFSIVQKIILPMIPWKEVINDTAIIVGVKYLCFWIFTFLLSILIYKYFEKPIMNLRDHKKFKHLF